MYYCVIKNKVAIEFAGDELAILNSESVVLLADNIWYTAPADVELRITRSLNDAKTVQLELGDRFYVSGNGLSLSIDRWADRFPDKG